jgi:hypothetical protein
MPALKNWHASFNPEGSYLVPVSGTRVFWNGSNSTFTEDKQTVFLPEEIKSKLPSMPLEGFIQ